MQWSKVRQVYPNQWLIIEALEAYTDGNQRVINRIAVIETCLDGSDALESYRRLHREYPLREFYFVHTSREQLEITERHWVGIRTNHATISER
jgi:hypothetical protein